MNRRNFALSAVALAAMALVPFSACQKEGGGGASGSSGDMLSYMPQDSSVIVGFSVKKATTSALFKKHQDKIMANASKELAEMKEKCGIDMMADMNSVVIAVGQNLQNPDDAVIGVKGNFNQKKIEDCVTKMGGKVEGSVMTSPDGDIMNAFWAAKDTILISKGKTADAIKASKEGKSVKQNKDLMTLIGKVDSGATLWVAGTIPPEVGGMMGGMGGTPPKSGFLSLNIDSGVDAKIGMIFNTEDEAKGMSTMIEMGLNMGKQQAEMKEILDAVSTSQDGDTIIIKAKISADLMTKVEAMAPGML
jgi:hypothetical protein